MHGIGNDYVYVDGFHETVADPAALARRVSDRHFGVGADGLILILPSEKADVRMRMFNADWSESEMCGNGVRCVAKYAFDHGLSRNNPMTVETGRGVLTLALAVREGKAEQVTVNMGEPILELARIPVDQKQLLFQRGPEWDFEISPGQEQGNLDYQLQAQEQTVLTGVFVSMGNPHAVIFVENIESPNVSYLGPMVEHHKAFVRRINAHWVQVVSRGEVIMKTWERGSGVTMACGTGACAVAVAGVLSGRTDRKILAHLPGGDLVLEWRESDNNVYMTGPAVEVFRGEMEEK
jgi:diaminopimelate epimerase